ncbi:glycoside hydrolase family 31 protein [Paenibacillus soyae]|uniref:Glycoside hydrolase family 31 protein n=1 Tax=Paenibacillus soyae TaxID=2969249 RepID=A0A9X2MP55_9BACL|nr:glycoside hydrolase family 31 protein [Paenibacillus soyae]MCR2803283.1 glycoside hydrolase family 31 protein [Paenibacillus soyae]
MTTSDLELKLMPDEYWWGGRAADGRSMPYGMELFEAELGATDKGNQACPLLLSNKGRFVWSEEPFAFRFEEGRLRIGANSGELISGDGFGTLKGAYLHVSRTYFPPVASIPEELLFTAPQYNLWIELLYEPTQEKVIQYAKDVLAHGMPPGVIMIDDNWHGPYGTWTFDSSRFPDPKSMVDELHSMGFQVMLWVCPFISPDSRTFRKLEGTGVLLKDREGKTAIRKWWNGYSAVLDCTNPDAVKWMQEQLDFLQTEYGIDGFKLDAGDIEFYENDDCSFVPTTCNGHCEAWARVGLKYRLNEYRACWKLAGQPLVQRLKDKCHEWQGNGLDALIPDGLAQGLLGHAYTCPDMIGGGEFLSFTSARLDAELFVRYAQCSALFPMMQFSAAPWRVLDKEHLEYCVEAAKLHTRMGQEIVELAEQSSVSGEPILRHMAYEFPEEGMELVRDQFMLGSSLLVAPIVTKGARTRQVVFPSGSWVGDDGSLMEGPSVQWIDAPLSRLPWYRKRQAD